MAHKARSVKGIFKDYCARRTALIHALTRYADQVYDLCDPENGMLCLFGHSDETWEVAPPEELVPTDLPEPIPGINIGRVGMHRVDWLHKVAAYSDSWLISVAFVNGYTLNRDRRNRLFNLINDLPNVAEVVVDHWNILKPR